MKAILKPFRGDPDVFEVTVPMKYLLGSFGVMLSLVPIFLYVMLQDVSDLTLAVFSNLLVVDLVLMVLVDVMIILIWGPSCFQKSRKRDKSNPGCASQCLPMQLTIDSVCSEPNDAFKDISVVELSRRLDYLHDEDEQGAKEGKESSPGDKLVCAVEVHKSSTSESDNPNLDQNRGFPEHALTPVSAGDVKGDQQQVSINPQRRDIKAIENLTYGYAVGDASGAYESNRKSASQNQIETFNRNFSVPGPSQKGFWYHKKQEYLTADPQHNMGDSKEKENSTFGCTGDAAAQSRACESIYANLDQSETVKRNFSVSGPSQKRFLQHKKQQYLKANPQQNMGDSEGKENSTFGCTGDAAAQSRAREPNYANLEQSGTSSEHVSPPPPKEDGLRQDRHRKQFWTKPQPCTRDSTHREDEVNLLHESLIKITGNPQPSMGDSKGKEKSIFGCSSSGDSAQSTAFRAYYAKLKQSGPPNEHVFIPVPSQVDGSIKIIRVQRNQIPSYFQQWMTELMKEKNSTSRCSSGVDQPNACERTDDGQGQNGKSSDLVSVPPPQEDGLRQDTQSERTDIGQDPNGKSSEHVTVRPPQEVGLRQDRQSERTDVGQDQNGTSSEHVSVPPPQEDGLRQERHRKRFWTEPQQLCIKDSTKRDDEVNLSSESLDEMIKNKELERSFKAKPKVRGFTKLKKRYYSPDYMESAFSRRRSSASSIPPSNIDDALELVPISYDQSKQSSTATWVFDDKNELPSNSDSSPSLKRSRSAPSNRRRRLISSATRPSDSSNRLPIPACVDDSRHRVLHRLLATILTTGDDVMIAHPELEHNYEDEDVLKMEVEALPSGDYVMHISMHLTSNEFQNFKVRRATNFKDSEFKKYLATLC